MAANKVLQVFIFKGGEFLGTDVFDKARILVGRDSDSADLVLESTHVSRRHAVIDVEGDRIFIQDAGSKNGIYVNDEPVQRTEITRLDKITVGDFTLKIKVVGSGDADQPQQRDKPREAGVSLGSTINAAFVKGITPPPLSSLLDASQMAPAAPPSEGRGRDVRTSELLDGPPDAVTRDIEVFQQEQRAKGGGTSELMGRP